jgi:hypothetical protein
VTSMLTDRQRTRCREIAAALDRHDLTLWRKWEPSLGAEERGAIWDMRGHVIAQAARERQKTLLPTDSKVSRPEAVVMRDLDYWSDDDAPIDDDVPDDQPTCSACGGSGKDAAGNECQVCGGTGKAPLDGDEEEDDE